jgi:hypothetical protein
MWTHVRNYARAAVAAAALALLLAALWSPASAAPRCAAPASDPNDDEVRAAMRIVGLPDATPAPTARAIHEECFSGTELAIYDHVVRVILVGEDWRDVGGLTRLIHEMKHYADDLAGSSRADECGAARLAAAWAEAHDFFNEARRERKYGAAACVDGDAALVASADSGEGSLPTGDGSYAAARFQPSYRMFISPLD